jgi:hypothetical protein
VSAGQVHPGVAVKHVRPAVTVISTVVVFNAALMGTAKQVLLFSKVDDCFHDLDSESTSSYRINQLESSNTTVV